MTELSSPRNHETRGTPEKGVPNAAYWSLSRRLSSAALAGDPLHVYLSRVAGELLAFAEASRVEIWCADTRWPFRLVHDAEEADSTPAVVPFPSGATNDVERLCLELTTGSRRPPGGDVVDRTEAQLVSVDLGGPTGGGKCLVLPFVARPAHGQDLWVVVLYPGPTRPFSRDVIPLHEEVMRSLATALSLRVAHASLRERMKELTCLYGIALLKESPATSLEDVLEGIVALLPPAWLYPEDAHATLVLDGRTYGSELAEDPVHGSLSADVVVRGVVRGRLEVTYVADHPALDRGPFLSEEVKLLETVAREVSLVMERRQAAEENARLERQLQRAERLATVGETAAGITHELNEPLNNILGFAQLIQTNAAVPSDVQRDLSLIVSSAMHARQVIRQLLLFSSRFYETHASVDLNDLVRNTLSFLDVICAKAGVKLSHDLEEGLDRVSASPDQLRQVLVNLVVNAAQATPRGGSIGITTSSARGDEGGICLVVEDSGPGVPDELREKIFMPFFTTREGGTGMGLSVAHGIVAAHGGRIALAGAPGKGARFEITLPVLSA